MDEYVPEQSLSVKETVFNTVQEIPLESIVSSFRKLFTEQDRCDVEIHFTDGSSSIFAHKIILSMTSEVLEEMLEKKDQITVSEPGTPFKWIVNHAYTGDLQVTDDLSFWIILCDLLKKYKMDAVKAAILQKLKFLITERNINELYQSNIVNEAAVKERCAYIIQAYGWKMISEAGKRNLSPQLISEILELDQIRISEEELFRILLAWAKFRLTFRFLKESGENFRNEMEQFLGKILFKKMDFGFFMKEVAPLEIFTDAEVCSLLKNTHKRSSSRSDEFMLAPIFTMNKKRRNFIHVSDLRIYNLVKNPFCGSVEANSSKVLELLFTLTAAEDIYIHCINSKSSCNLGYFKVVVEDPINGSNWRTSSGPIWKFHVPFKITPNITYKFYLEGHGRTSRHNFRMYCGYPSNIEIFGEVASCHVAIHYS